MFVNLHVLICEGNIHNINISVGVSVQEHYGKFFLPRSVSLFLCVCLCLSVDCLHLSIPLALFYSVRSSLCLSLDI